MYLHDFMWISRLQHTSLHHAVPVRWLQKRLSRGLGRSIFLGYASSWAMHLPSFEELFRNFNSRISNEYFLEYEVVKKRVPHFLMMDSWSVKTRLWGKKVKELIGNVHNQSPFMLKKSLFQSSLYLLPSGIK